MKELDDNLKTTLKETTVEYTRDGTITGHNKQQNQLFDDAKTTLEKHWNAFSEILNKKNLSRKECLLLPLKTILKALKI